MDQSLHYIEMQQDEMSSLLDNYESQVRDLESQAVLQPVDQERESTYTLAEKLNEDLEGVGKQLESMIGDMNGISASMNKAKEDDPLAQVIKILNSQLSSLQWIENTANSLQEKMDDLNQVGTHIQKGQRKQQGFNYSPYR